MPTVNGNSVNHWHAWMTYNITDGPDYVDISVQAGPEAEKWGFNINSMTTYVKCTQWRNEVSYTGSFYSPTGGTGWNTHINQTWRIAKDHNSYSAAITFRCVNSSGYMNGTSSGSASFTLGAKSHSTISFNANGGSNAPSAQTKWYGEILRLSTGVPTRANYTFQGWATSANGTVAYRPGDNYGLDGNATLYAVWKLAHIPPTLSNFSAQRCTSSGTVSDSGTYIRVSANYKADTTTNSANKITSAVVGWGSSSASSSPNVASGTFTQIVGANAINTGSSYTVTLKMTDSNGQSDQVSTVVGPSFALMDVDGANKGVSFGRVCPGTGFYVDTTGKIDFNGLTLSSGKSNMAQQIRNSLDVYDRLSSRRSAFLALNGVQTGNLNNHTVGVMTFNPNTAGVPAAGAYGVCLAFSTLDYSPGTNNMWIAQIAVTTNNYMYVRVRANTGAWQSWWTVAWK